MAASEKEDIMAMLGGMESFDWKGGLHLKPGRFNSTLMEIGTVGGP